jgi:transposase
VPRSKKRASRSGQLVVVHPRAAGIDIGSTFHVVAVPRERDDRPVRTFRTFSADLHQLAEWLTAVGITTVAMESTGVYWIPVFEILEARGFEVLLVNARDVKHVPGRKTDVNDAQWLQQLHQHGLLRGSFRPRDGVVRLRAYLRHRERLVDYAASHIQHMQKALMQMNVQLHHAVADITGATGMRIIRAIVAGNHDPDQLATYRDVRCHASEARSGTRSRGIIDPSISSRYDRRWSYTTSIRRRLPTAMWKSSWSCASSIHRVTCPRFRFRRLATRRRVGTSPRSTPDRRSTVC